MRHSLLFLLGLTLIIPAALQLRSEAEAAAQLVATIDTGEDLAVVAAWSHDGQRLAYGTEKRMQRRKYSLSAEDGARSYYPGEVWITDFSKKPKRILKHNFLWRLVGESFSFSIERLAWSADGSKLAVEILDQDKDTNTFLITAKGKRVKLGSRGGNFVPVYESAWLADNQSLAVLTEALAPRLLHQVGLLRVRAGRALPLFRKHTFAAVAWLPRSNRAALVERDREFSEPPRLLLGDLIGGTLELLTELSDGYLGGLQVTPDGTRLSYFVGQEKLAVRELAPEAEAKHWPIPFGRYAWAGNTVLFLDRESAASRSGWLTRYDPAGDEKQRVLAEELIHDFWVSPDGRQVAVLTADEKPALKVYRLAPTSPRP